MKIPPNKIIVVTLIIGILITTVGLFLFFQGPREYFVEISNLYSKSFSGGKDWEYYNITVFPERFSEFVVELNFSTDFDENNLDFEVYLLNETQYINWNVSKSDYLLKSNYPDYDFSLNVSAQKYYLAINTTNIENDMINVLMKLEGEYVNYDYTTVWPNLFLTLIGIALINIMIILIRKSNMAKAFNYQIKKRIISKQKFPSKKAFDKNFNDYYNKFINPALFWIILGLPILIVVVFLLPLIPPASQFSSVMWDFLARFALTHYFAFLILFLSLFFNFLLEIKLSSLPFRISSKFGILKRTDFRHVNNIESLSFTNYMKKTNLIIIFSPIMILLGVYGLNPTIFYIQEKIGNVFWVFLVLLICYFGLFASYLKSRFILEYVHHNLKTRAFLSRLKSFYAIENLIHIFQYLVYFFIWITSLALLLTFINTSILSSSLAYQYGLVTTRIQTLAILPYFGLFIEVACGFGLLFSIFFYGISGYLIPELIYRGYKAATVSGIAFTLTFITDRGLSILFEPYLEVDLVLSVIISFGVSILVFFFEKFYNRLLGRFKD